MLDNIVSQNDSKIDLPYSVLVTQILEILKTFKLYMIVQHCHEL